MRACRAPSISKREKRRPSGQHTVAEKEEDSERGGVTSCCFERELVVFEHVQTQTHSLRPVTVPHMYMRQ